MQKHCILSLKMNKDLSFFKVRKYKLENHKNITINHLNANSLRNKFFLAEELIKTKLDIFLISKTKTDHNFPISSFQFMDTKCIYQKEQGYFGGELLFYINEYTLQRINTCSN